MQKWSNKEWDGTIFIISMVIAFLSIIILTYKSKEFAALESTKLILEIVKGMFFFMAGYLFKRASENGGTSEDK